MDGACSPGYFSRWWIVTLMGLILLISLICADATVCTVSRLVCCRRKSVQAASVSSGCQDQENHCDQSDQCSHTFGANRGLAPGFVAPDEAKLIKMLRTRISSASAKACRDTTDTNRHEVILRCAMGGACSTGDFSRSVYSNTDGTDFADGTDLCSRFGLHGEQASIAPPPIC